jgi:heterodisulfide reductase subunit B2
VASYYGCLFVRPGDVADFDDEENPQSMDRLLAAAGAETVDWAFKTECCGASMAVARPPEVERLSGRVLATAKRLGADCIAVACPLCHANLDQRQGSIGAKLGKDVAVPVLYFTQLLGLALGLPAKDMMLGRHFADPRPMLRAKGLV